MIIISSHISLQKLSQSTAVFDETFISVGVPSVLKCGVFVGLAVIALAEDDYVEKVRRGIHEGFTVEELLGTL